MGLVQGTPGHREVTQPERGYPPRGPWHSILAQHPHPGNKALPST